MLSQLRQAVLRFDKQLCMSLVTTKPTRLKHRLDGVGHLRISIQASRVSSSRPLVSCVQASLLGEAAAAQVRQGLGRCMREQRHAILDFLLSLRTEIPAEE